jgi:hypothetical protein
MTAGAGDERLGRIRKDGDIGGAGAAGEGGTELERRAGFCLLRRGLGRFRGVLSRDEGRGVGNGRVDGDTAGSAVGDDEGPHVGRDAREARLLAGTDDGNLAAAVEIDDADGVGAGVGDVGSASRGVDADEIGLPMNSDGGGDGVGGRVDDGDGSGAGVDGVDLVARRIGGDSRGVVANPQGAVAAQIDEVEDADGVGASVGDVGVLAIACGNIGKAAAAATQGQNQRKAGRASSLAGYGGISALERVYRSESGCRKLRRLKKDFSKCETFRSESVSTQMMWRVARWGALASSVILLGQRSYFM